MQRILYVTSDELIEYAASRGVAISSEEALVLVNNAQDYIDAMYTFCGTAVYKSSAFPRRGLKDYDDTDIPYAVKAATLYAALQIQIGTPFTAGKKATPQVKKVTIGTGSISREYATNYKESPVQEAVYLQYCTKLLDDDDLLCGSPYGIGNMYALRG